VEKVERYKQEADFAFREGRLTEAAELALAAEASAEDVETSVTCGVFAGAILFDAGRCVESLRVLTRVVSGNRARAAERTQLRAELALFSRESQFQDPGRSLPNLAQLRQASTRAADLRCLADLHLVVARQEAFRGLCINARRHLMLSRQLYARTEIGAPASVHLVDAGLEMYSGNLSRCTRSAAGGLEVSARTGASSALAGGLANLGSVNLLTGRPEEAEQLLERAWSVSGEFRIVRFSVADARVQLALLRDDLPACREALVSASALQAEHDLPARSWYDLAHQITRTAYHERLEDWDAMVTICDDTDAEVARRQYRAVRTALLCAKARALAHLGRRDQAQAALSLAVRSCPRGAVDPLIVLEASHAVCLALRGDIPAGRVHFARALSACRAIGHRYHEQWIERSEREIVGERRQTVAVDRPAVDLGDAALLFADIGTVLGAGHSIDLLAHRTMSLLRSTGLGARLNVEDEAGCEFQAEPSAHCETTADGTFEVQLRGSDRRVVIRVREVGRLEEIAVLRGIADLVRAAVHQTSGTTHEDDEETLWPRTTVTSDDDHVFRSPRMIELVRIAMRLASADLPILLTGETGTGKEIFARLIHEHSKVKRGPFIGFNCTALPRDLVESQLFGHRKGAFTGATDSSIGVIRAADGGTLFLDELADLDLSIQPKLLRWLEQGEVQPVGELRPVMASARLVAATNGKLEDLVAQGRFRADLFYRLGGAQLALPPLRERKDEIPALAELFLTRFARECDRKGLRLADDFVAALLLHHWPGNLRELANEIRRVVAMASDGDVLSSTDLLPHITERWSSRPAPSEARRPARVEVGLDQTLAQAMAELEQKFIAHALSVTQGRVTEAADLLGLSRKGLFLKRRRRGLIARHAAAHTSAVVDNDSDAMEA
jgi:transcriptional regulator with PAS, ATPase and Fis domain/tetratricopeptide (TPR) repeat protein